PEQVGGIQAAKPAMMLRDELRAVPEAAIALVVIGGNDRLSVDRDAGEGDELLADRVADGAVAGGQQSATPADELFQPAWVLAQFCQGAQHDEDGLSRVLLQGLEVFQGTQTLVEEDAAEDLRPLQQLLAAAFRRLLVLCRRRPVQQPQKQSPQQQA